MAVYGAHQEGATDYEDSIEQCNLANGRYDRITDLVTFLSAICGGTFSLGRSGVGTGYVVGSLGISPFFASVP